MVTRNMLGELNPRADALVAALAAKHRLRVQVSGARAANPLGLSNSERAGVASAADGWLGFEEK
jgi:hypothetical protein